MVRPLRGRRRPEGRVRFDAPSRRHLDGPCAHVPLEAKAMQHPALTLVHVDRGAPRPDEETLRVALRRDREGLHRPQGCLGEIAVAGPYPVRVDGRDVDEYVVWER
jgi:hypothetical protein